MCSFSRCVSDDTDRNRRSTPTYCRSLGTVSPDIIPIICNIYLSQYITPLSFCQVSEDGIF